MAANKSGLQLSTIRSIAGCCSSVRISVLAIQQHGKIITSRKKACHLGGLFRMKAYLFFALSKLSLIAKNAGAGA
jgi:hypothetical protein